MPHHRKLASIASALTAIVAINAFAEETTESSEDATEKPSRFALFKDPEDGWFDMSRYLLEKGYGFLPVPIIITEPAVDNGLGLAGVYFHPPGPNDRKPEKGDFIVTDLTGAAAAYTGNDSWFVGGAHFNTWRQDTRRYTGAIGYADINLKWFGGSEIMLPGGFGFNVKGAFLDQKIEFRLGETSWFFGGEWRYLNSDVKFDIPLPVEPPSVESAVSGIGALANFEKLNSRLSPTKGFNANIRLMINNEAIGSDFDYEELSWKLRQYFNFGDKFTFSWRFDGATTDGDVPFYLQPYISIQGIPVLRYQGETAATAEVRGGYDIHPRWTLMAFVGGGRAADSISDMFDASTEGALGGGFRYLIARALGLRVGIDVARGPEDTYFYLVMGNAWGGGFF